MAQARPRVLDSLQAVIDQNQDRKIVVTSNGWKNNEEGFQIDTCNMLIFATKSKPKLSIEQWRKCAVIQQAENLQCLTIYLFFFQKRKFGFQCIFEEIHSLGECIFRGNSFPQGMNSNAFIT